MTSSVATSADTVSQDDMNGFRASRYRYSNIIANPSLEYTSPFYGFAFVPSANGGSGVRYCSGSTDGNCFVRVDGAGIGGAAYKQSMEIQNAVDKGIRDNVVDVSVRFRGQVSGTVTLALFYDNLGTNANVNCSVTVNTWSTCSLSSVDMPGTATSLTMQVINYTNGYVDVDRFVMRD